MHNKKDSYVRCRTLFSKHNVLADFDLKKKLSLTVPVTVAGMLVITVLVIAVSGNVVLSVLSNT